MTHIKWPEILNFHNLRRELIKYPEVLQGDSVVTYRGKIKLHGTNAAIQILHDGTLKVQSRTAIITSHNDNCGFATWVDSQQESWRAVVSLEKDMIIFGEWAGSGIMKGTAINNLPNKIFAVFAVAMRDLASDVLDFIIEPEEITRLIGKINQVYVLPWYDKNGIIFEPKIEWLAVVDNLQSTVDLINEEVKAIDTCDPWVKKVFGIEGVGEGLVFYPISHLGRKSFGDLAFKAKGEKHKVVKTKESVQIDPEIVASAEEFAQLVLTEQRLEQGVRELNAGELVFDIQKVGPFIGWICKDVKKETEAELQESNLTWKQVQNSISSFAKQWFVSKTR